MPTQIQNNMLGTTEFVSVLKMIKFMQALIQEECQDDEFPVEQAEVGWREEGGG